MDTTKLVIPPGGGATWEMAPGRSAALKITSDIAQSVMMFEEVAPTDTVTDLDVFCSYTLLVTRAGLFNAQYMMRMARIALMPPKAMRCRPSETL